MLSWQMAVPGHASQACTHAQHGLAVLPLATIALTLFGKRVQQGQSMRHSATG